MNQAASPVILFRSDGTSEREEEFQAARKHFPVVRYRSDVPAESLVISRYYSLPNHRELVVDLAANDSKLSNTAQGHSWIVSMDWAEDLKLWTPRTWDERAFPLSDYKGPFVVKGKTNSKGKLDWRRFMFAEDRQAAIRVAGELSHDSEIGRQGIVYREFVPLKTFETDFTGLPIANEHRLFFWRTTLVDKGYYWSSASDEAKSKAVLSDDGLRLAKRAARIAAERAVFFVIDVAEKADGGWIVIEVNSGEQAGLSEIDPDSFYSKLREVVERDRILDLCGQCGVPEGDDHWSRAGGNCVCSVCGREYDRHPMDETHVGLNGALWLHRICDGRLVKT